MFHTLSGITIGNKEFDWLTTFGGTATSGRSPHFAALVSGVDLLRSSNESVSRYEAPSTASSLVASSRGPGPAWLVAEHEAQPLAQRPETKWFRIQGANVDAAETVSLNLYVDGEIAPPSIQWTWKTPTGAASHDGNDQLATIWSSDAILGISGATDATAKVSLHATWGSDIAQWGADWDMACSACLVSIDDARGPGFGDFSRWSGLLPSVLVEDLTLAPVLAVNATGIPVLVAWNGAGLDFIDATTGLPQASEAVTVLDGGEPLRLGHAPSDGGDHVWLEQGVVETINTGDLGWDFTEPVKLSSARFSRINATSFEETCSADWSTAPTVLTEQGLAQGSSGGVVLGSARGYVSRLGPDACLKDWSASPLDVGDEIRFTVESYGRNLLGPQVAVAIVEAQLDRLGWIEIRAVDQSILTDVGKVPTRSVWNLHTFVFDPAQYIHPKLR